MFLMIRNLSGSSPITGLTLSATGLYFFPLIFFAVFVTAVSEETEETLPKYEEGPNEGGTEILPEVTFDSGLRYAIVR